MNAFEALEASADRHKYIETDENLGEAILTRFFPQVL